MKADTKHLAQGAGVKVSLLRGEFATALRLPALKFHPMKRESELAAKIRKHLKSLELGKKHYKRADAILAEIVNENLMEPGQPVKLNEQGRKAVLVDRYAEKLTVFQPCGVRRYEFDVIDA
jgi:hypothetical protein